MRRIAIVLPGLLGGVLACAQQSRNFTFDLLVNYGPSLTVEDALVWTLSGSAGPLGSASLKLSASAPDPGPYSEPVQISGGLYFNALDSIGISFTITDPNFWNTLPYPGSLTGGTITGGTGAYSGATGSLDLNFPQGAVTGTGSVTVGGNTTPLNLSNFYGSYCPNNCARYYFNGTISGSTSLSNVTGSLKIDDTFTMMNSSIPAVGPATIAFNDTDSIAFMMNFSGSPVTFKIVGGTGAYAGATGSLNVSSIHSGYSGYEYKGSGTVNTPPAPGPVITQVKMAYGSSATIARNGWLEIHGINLVPPDTPGTGVDWSNAPEFASGTMPTSLGAISSVTVGGTPAYIYFYCSAATDPSCAQGDQINVLSPIMSFTGDILVTVTRNDGATALFPMAERDVSPALPFFDQQGHVIARHADYSLLGPTSLFPGASTPAKAGETVILVMFGAGIPPGAVDGSATQTGVLLFTPRCWVSGLGASVTDAVISPGLTQLNVTLPSSLPSGENAIVCDAAGGPTPAGGIITVQ